MTDMTREQRELPSRVLTVARLEGIKEWAVRFYESGHTFMGVEAMGAIDAAIAALREPKSGNGGDPNDKA